MVQQHNEGTFLSRTVTVSQYLEMEKLQNREGIAEFFNERITERYITPFSCIHIKNGFIMMASACLMIETLESFWEGWKDTNGKSQQAFKKYFSRHSDFEDFRELSEEFYKNIRCGIMHQGETTGGWHIRRDVKLFDPEMKTVNATKFLELIEISLNEYCDKLRSEDWNIEIWEKFRKKMKYVCSNTA